MFREGYDLRAVTLAACAAAGVEPHLVSEGGEMAGVLSFVSAGLGAAVVPAIALPGDGSLVGIPFTGPTLSRTVALAQRGGRALARPARALADELLARHATPARRVARRKRPLSRDAWVHARARAGRTARRASGLGSVHGRPFPLRPVGHAQPGAREATRRPAARPGGPALRRGGSR